MCVCMYVCVRSSCVTPMPMNQCVQALRSEVRAVRAGQEELGAHASVLEEALATAEVRERKSEGGWMPCHAHHHRRRN